MQKKMKILMVILLTVMLSACGSSKITTDALVSVDSKDITNSTYWIEVKNIDDPDHENIKLQVESENLWNIIEIDKEYTVTYIHKKDVNKGELSVIRNSK